MTAGNGENGERSAPAFRRTDRTDAPYYLARYTERRGLEQSARTTSPAEVDEDLPLYLRRFRERARDGQGRAAASAALLEVDGERFTREFAGASRDKEIVPPPERKAQEDFATEIRIIRHGITQGYQTDSGLTPMGGWQSHQRGHSLSKSVRPGQKVRIVCADTSRARQTADQIYRGMTDGLAQWGREADISKPEPIPELRNFQVWTPEGPRDVTDQIYRGMTDGLAQWGREADISKPEPIPELRNFQVWTPEGPRDVTSAFRQYQALMEKLERMAVGDRPRWLVEIDRFYRNQLGGADPIYMWLTIPLMYFEPPQSCVRRFWRGFHRLMAELTIPLMYFEPPQSCVRRFWRGFHRLMAESPDTRIIAATHSGPIRAFATWAHGYDPGEPYNTEEVVVRIRRGGGTALVAYRNRVTEVNVPPPDEMPVWD